MKLSAKARRKMKAKAKVCGARQTVNQSGKQTTIVNVGRHCRPVKRRRPRKRKKDPFGDAEQAFSARMGRRVDLTTLRPEYQEVMRAHNTVQRLGLYAQPAASPAAAPAQNVYVYQQPPPGLTAEQAAKMGRGAQSGESTLAAEAAGAERVVGGGAGLSTPARSTGGVARSLSGELGDSPGDSPGIGSQIRGIFSRSSSKIYPY